MSFIEDTIRSVTDPLEDAFKSVTGQTAEDTSRDNAIRAEAAGQKAIELGQVAAGNFGERLQPYADFGSGLLPRANILFGSSAGESILQDPVLQALQSDAEERILASQAARGRTAAGDTAPLLQDAFLRTGTEFLNNERSNVLSGLNFGRDSDTQIGGANLSAAGVSGDLLTQIANAQNASAIAGDTARSGGIGNLIDLGSTIAGGIAGLPFGGGGDGVQTTGTNQALYGTASTMG